MPVHTQTVSVEHPTAHETIDYDPTNRNRDQHEAGVFGGQHLERQRYEHESADAWNLYRKQREAARSRRRRKFFVLQLLITILLGALVGLAGYFVHLVNHFLLHIPLQVMEILHTNSGSGGGSGTALTAAVVFCLVSGAYLAVSASLVIHGSWSVRGSGVGHLNAYLTGVYTGHLYNMKTWVLKVLSTVLTVSSQIKQGLEGPFLLVGAMCGVRAADVVGAISRRFPTLGWQKYMRLLSDATEQRVFLSAGAAAGFSVAFNAPVAGICYVQENAVAFMSGDLLFRMLVASFSGVWVVNMCLSPDHGITLPSRGLISADTQDAVVIHAAEMVAFGFLGLCGGVLAAAFTKLNLLVSHWRHYVLSKHKWKNYADVMGCALVTYVIFFLLSYTFPCATLPSEGDTGSVTSRPAYIIGHAIHLQCSDGSYTPTGTLLFSPPEVSIRIALDRSHAHSDDALGLTPLLLVLPALVMYTSVACTYAMAVSGGIFVPNLMVGALLGRAFAHFLQILLPSGTAFAHPGVYALVGGASLLGGVSRMVLPICVMSLEISGDIQLLLPVLLATLLSKSVADHLVGGLYGEHMRLEGLPLLFGDRPPDCFTGLNATHVMNTTTLRTVTTVDKVSHLVELIHTTSHNAFPVVVTPEEKAQGQGQTQEPGAANRTHKRARSERKTTASTPLQGLFDSPSEQHGAESVPEEESKKEEEEEEEEEEPDDKEEEEDEDKAEEELPHGTLAHVLVHSHIRQHNAHHDDCTTGVFVGLVYRDQVRAAVEGVHQQFDTQAAAQAAAEAVAERVQTLQEATETVGLDIQQHRSLEIPRGDAIDENGAMPTPPPDANAPRGVSPLLTQRDMRGGASSAAELSSEPVADIDSSSALAADAFYTPRGGATNDNNTMGAGNGVHLSTEVASLAESVMCMAELNQQTLPIGVKTPTAAEHLEAFDPFRTVHDIRVDLASCDTYVNMLPYVDMGSFVVSTNTPAKRIWVLFRNVGMRHVAVLDHQHACVGVITRKDLIRAAKLYASAAAVAETRR